MLFSLSQYTRHKFFSLKLETLQQSIFKRFFFGKNIDRLNEQVELFLSKRLSEMIYQPAFSCLKLALQEAKHVAIISSSPDFLVEPIARRLGVKDVYATRYSIDKDRKLCHIASVVSGESKAQILRELAQRHRIEKEAIAAYSDSYLDLLFLQAAGYPVGVNPDRQLLKICLKNNWKII